MTSNDDVKAVVLFSITLLAFYGQMYKVQVKIP